MRYVKLFNMFFVSEVDFFIKVVVFVLFLFLFGHLCVHISSLLKSLCSWVIKQSNKLECSLQPAASG